jgi:hypothetical protein
MRCTISWRRTNNNFAFLQIRIYFTICNSPDMKKNPSPLAWHAIALGVFIGISLIYFSPMLEGKRMSTPGDTMQYQGMSSEKTAYENRSDEAILWTNSMFGGMPTYLIGAPKPPWLLKTLNRIFLLNGKLRPLSFILLYLIGFYITLIAFGVRPQLSIAGAIAFAFSSYFFVIITAGHASKAIAIGYMPPIIGGVYLAFRGRILLGSVITALFLALQLVNNHLQISYYTLLIIFVLGIFEFVHAIREKQLKFFLTTVGALFIAVFLAVGSNAATLWTTNEYGKYSTRGKSELQTDASDQTSGLDKSYITGWSYGIDETFTLLIPNFKGGASAAPLPENSETYKYFSQAQGSQYARQVIRYMPLYWGTQSSTAGPVYVGAVVLFLFVFGFIMLRSRLRWWLLTLTILAIMLSWGRHFMILSNLFIDYFPGYNKFRTVTMILVIAEFAIPLLAFVALDRMLQQEPNKKDFMKGLKWSLYIVGGLALFFLVFAGMFSFTGPGDQRYMSQGGSNPFMDALMADRQTLFRKDALRSLILVLLSAGLLYAFYFKKIKQNLFFAGLALLVLVDMWPVDKRYLNNKDFGPKRTQQQGFQPMAADQQILQDPDPYFRVFDVSGDPFNSAHASYFHKSIGGYHGAKMQRYQDIISYQIAKNNMNVLDMLNTKYFIVPVKDGEPVARLNPGALGNAWLVSSYRIVENANEEMDALNNFDPATEAIIDRRFEQYVTGKTFSSDTAAEISLVSYHPNRLSYSYKGSRENLAVFSDIYYDRGWKSFVDGAEVPHFRVDYLIRGMVLPAGEHSIEFRFEPRSYFVGKKIASASSYLLFIFLLGAIGWEVRQRNRKKDN